MEPWIKLGADKKHRGFAAEDIAQKVSPECVQGCVQSVEQDTRRGREGEEEIIKLLFNCV